MTIPTQNDGPYCPSGNSHNPGDAASPTFINTPFSQNFDDLAAEHKKE